MNAGQIVLSRTLVDCERLPTAMLIESPRQEKKSLDPLATLPSPNALCSATRNFSSDPAASRDASESFSAPETASAATERWNCSSSVRSNLRRQRRRERVRGVARRVAVGHGFGPANRTCRSAGP